mmetsp:Transcript_98943/g.300299  ORF Transcript_98943/g.300299 Transcript_98943/m.300299 type:complete len:202 (-) Transcript_98943:458-1063(-)
MEPTSIGPEHGEVALTVIQLDDEIIVLVEREQPACGAWGNAGGRVEGGQNLGIDHKGGRIGQSGYPRDIHPPPSGPGGHWPGGIEHANLLAVLAVAQPNHAGQAPADDHPVAHLEGGGGVGKLWRQRGGGGDLNGGAHDNVVHHDRRGHLRRGSSGLRAGGLDDDDRRGRLARVGALVIHTHLLLSVDALLPPLALRLAGH